MFAKVAGARRVTCITRRLRRRLLSAEVFASWPFQDRVGSIPARPIWAEFRLRSATPPTAVFLAEVGVARNQSTICEPHEVL